MTEDVAQAIAVLQVRCLELQWRSPYWNERFQGALDYLTRNPHRIGDPRKVVRDALSNAGKQLRRRQGIVAIRLESQLTHVDGSVAPLEEQIPGEGCNDGVEHLMIELQDWLEHSTLSDRDSRIIRLLMAGHTPESISRLQSAPLPGIRVQVTRAQTRARALWGAA